MTKRLSKIGVALVVTTALAGCSSGSTASPTTGSTSSTSSTTSTSPTTTTTGAGAATTTTVSSGSNGVASESPPEILNSALQAMESAHSVRLSVKGTDGGDPIVIDVTSFSNGDVSGTGSLNGHQASLIIIGETLYIDAGAAYWLASSVSQSTANKFADHWVSGPSTGSYSGYTMSSLASGLKASEGSATAGETGTIDGQAAVSIHFSTGPLWVATTGEPYPIEADGTGGSVIFSDWNEGSIPTVPSGAKPASSF